MDIKTSFYLPIVLGTNKHLSHINTKSIFIRRWEVSKIRSNDRAEKIISLVNIINNEEIDYSYLVGWESAKILLSKICVDYNYKTRIVFVGQTGNFILGFEYYRLTHKFYKKFEVEYSVIEIGKFIAPNSLEVNSILKYHNHSAYLSDNMNKTNNIYDGIISYDYSMIQNLHPKGYYLNIIPRGNFDIHCMYSAFIFKKSILIDAPILTELFILNNSVRNASRENSIIAKTIPISPSSYNPEIYENIVSELNLRNISKTITTRQEQLNKVDFQALWFELNEDFTSTQLTEDILSNGISKDHDENNDHENNESKH